MRIPKTSLVAAIVLVVGIVAIVAVKNFIPSPNVAFTPTPVASPEDEVPFEGFPDQRLIQSSPPRSQITGPGSCDLSNGKIVFLSPTTARHEKATLTYRNIDDPARLILWRVEPNDGLVRVGPNIFSGLKLPNGSTSLTVVFNEGNRASRYTLTASVSYGIFQDGAVIGTTPAECRGKITVESNY